MRKKDKKRSVCGQAMFETLISTVLVTCMVFAGIQLVILAVNALIMNEAAFAISRVAIVCKDDNEVRTRTRLAALLVLVPHLNVKNVKFIPTDVPVKEASIGSRSGGPQATIFNTTVQYVQSIMFGRFFSGPEILSIANINVLRGFSRARAVKSPDEKYYDRAYEKDEGRVVGYY